MSEFMKEALIIFSLIWWGLITVAVLAALVLIVVDLFLNSGPAFGLVAFAFVSVLTGLALWSENN